MTAQEKDQCANCSGSTESVILRSFDSVNDCGVVPECASDLCPQYADYVDDDSNVTVNVIFHVITANPALVVPPGRVAGLIAAANGHFAGTMVNSTSSMGPVDTKINFVAATLSPDGVPLAVPGMETNLVTPATFAAIWTAGNENATVTNAYQRFNYGPRYVNLYVVDDSAFYLDNDPNTTSLANVTAVGILLNSPRFLAVPGAISTGFGSTVAHELGHYFGLIHVDGDTYTCCIPTDEDPCNCLETGDHVCDTQEVVLPGLIPCEGVFRIQG